MKQDARYTITHFSNAADHAINGATLHPELVTINVAEAIAEDLATMLGKRDAYENAKSTWADRRETMRAVTTTARKRLAIARDLLKPYLGTRYNQSWDSTGLVRSTEIPRAFEQVKALLTSFKAHFSAHPERENAALNITAAHFAVLHASMVAAQNNATNLEMEVKTLLAERNEAIGAMEKRVRSLFVELKLRLSPLDPRWLAFGFKLPGLKERPETPGAVEPVVESDEAISVKWKPTPRAEHYRVWVKEEGKEPKAIGSSREVHFVIDDLKNYAESVEIGVSAVNRGGESAISEWKKVKTRKEATTGQNATNSAPDSLPERNEERLETAESSRGATSIHLEGLHG